MVSGWLPELINARKKHIITDLVSLRCDVVPTEIVKQQRRSLWTEEQSLEARHVYQTRRISQMY